MEWVQTCGCCPMQYDIYDNCIKVAVFRFRFGELNVYSAEKGSGVPVINDVIFHRTIGGDDLLGILDISLVESMKPEIENEINKSRLRGVLPVGQDPENTIYMTGDQARANIRPGWRLNPNEKTVAGIIRGINRNKGQCPCHNDSEDKTCPCSDYRINNICHCNLYIRDDEYVTV